jgi:hypothetical protein
MKEFREFLHGQKEIGEPLFFLKIGNSLQEYADATRYSIEINYRTNVDEVLEAFAKIALGFVSAGIKGHDYHVKHVYTEKPLRILVSSRNWDDGEWVVVVSWNPQHKCFVVSKGFYNKDRRTISVQDSEKCKGDNSAEITKQVLNMMHDLKGKPSRNTEKLKGVLLKRGPKS